MRNSRYTVYPVLPDRTPFVFFEFMIIAVFVQLIFCECGNLFFLKRSEIIGNGSIKFVKLLSVLEISHGSVVILQRCFIHRSEMYGCVNSFTAVHRVPLLVILIKYKVGMLNYITFGFQFSVYFFDLFGNDFNRFVLGYIHTDIFISLVVDNRRDFII